MTFPGVATFFEEVGNRLLHEAQCTKGRSRAAQAYLQLA